MLLAAGAKLNLCKNTKTFLDKTPTPIVQFYFILDEIHSTISDYLLLASNKEAQDIKQNLLKQINELAEKTLKIGQELNSPIKDQAMYKLGVLLYKAYPGVNTIFIHQALAMVDQRQLSLAIDIPPDAFARTRAILHELTTAEFGSTVAEEVGMERKFACEKPIDPASDKSLDTDIESCSVANSIPSSVKETRDKLAKKLKFAIDGSVGGEVPLQLVQRNLIEFFTGEDTMLQLPPPGNSIGETIVNCLHDFKEKYEALALAVAKSALTDKAADTKIKKDSGPEEASTVAALHPQFNISKNPEFAAKTVDPKSKHKQGKRRSSFS